jgi:hypothetical protein
MDFPTVTSRNYWPSAVSPSITSPSTGGCSGSLRSSSRRPGRADGKPSRSACRPCATPPVGGLTGCRTGSTMRSGPTFAAARCQGGRGPHFAARAAGSPRALDDAPAGVSEHVPEPWPDAVRPRSPAPCGLRSRLRSGLPAHAAIGAGFAQWQGPPCCGEYGYWAGSGTAELNESGFGEQGAHGVPGA